MFLNQLAPRSYHLVTKVIHGAEFPSCWTWTTSLTKVSGAKKETIFLGHSLHALLTLHSTTRVQSWGVIRQHTDCLLPSNTRTKCTSSEHGTSSTIVPQYRSTGTRMHERRLPSQDLVS